MMMADISFDFNPCCCISLGAGTTLISVFDMIYGTAYIFRYRYLEAMTEEYVEFFPKPVPKPTNYSFMHAMFRYGNYALMITSGLILFVASQYMLRRYYSKLSFLCYVWLFMWAFLVISFSMFCNKLISSDEPHFVRYGLEILVNVMLHLYFVCVIIMFIRESRMEFNTLRAIKPINIERQDHEEYLRSGENNRFHDATSYHFLLPHVFLNSPEQRGGDSAGHESTEFRRSELLSMDPSLLQYSIERSKVALKSPSDSSLVVEVDSQSTANRDIDDSSAVTLAERSQIMSEVDTSYVPSQFSSLAPLLPSSATMERTKHEKKDTIKRIPSTLPEEPNVVEYRLKITESVGSLLGKPTESMANMLGTS